MNTRTKRVANIKQMASTIFHIQGNLTWRWGRTKRGNYVAVCDPIRQTVQAEKFSELLATIDEALGSTFNELLSTGDFERFLREQGWSCPSVPPVQARRPVRFDMPFNLEGVRRRDREEVLC